MKKHKILKMLIIALVCITNISGIFSKNTVKAVTAPIKSAEPYSKGEVVLSLNAPIMG